MTNTQKKRRPWIVGLPVIIILLLGVLAVYQLRGRAGDQAVRLDSGMHMIMGTFSRIVVLAPSTEAGQAGIAAALAQQRHIDRLMSYHKADSELNRINAQAHEHPVKIHEDTFTVLQKALAVSRQSNGAFDVTFTPVGDLWKEAADNNTAPTKEQLAQAKTKVGWQKLRRLPAI